MPDAQKEWRTLTEFSAPRRAGDRSSTALFRSTNTFADKTGFFGIWTPLCGHARVELNTDSRRGQRTHGQESQRDSCFESGNRPSTSKFQAKSHRGIEQPADGHLFRSLPALKRSSAWFASAFLRRTLATASSCLHVAYLGRVQKGESEGGGGAGATCRCSWHLFSCP